MEIIFSWGDNKISFKYKTDDESTSRENIFRDNFEIKYITTNYSGNSSISSLDAINLDYNPYNIKCKIWDNETNFNTTFIIRINNNKNYCFEINKNNCRLLEMSENKCKKFIYNAGITD